MDKQKEDSLAAIKYISEELGIDLEDDSTSIATPNRNAVARTYDDSLKVTVFNNERCVEIDIPDLPSLRIELVESGSHQLDPDEAIYRIKACKKSSQKLKGESLNGDINSVYAGRSGLILDDAARERAAKLYKKDRLLK